MYAVMLVKTTSTTSKASMSFLPLASNPPPQSRRSPGGIDKLFGATGRNRCLTKRCSTTRARLSGCRCHSCDLPPLLETLAHGLAVAGGCKPVTSCAEVIAHHTERLQELLRLLGRLESLHHPLAFANRPIRILGLVV